MGHRKIDGVLLQDWIGDSKPIYEFNYLANIWHLDVNGHEGAGELVSKISNLKVMLPMLLNSSWDWKNELRKALAKVILSKPQARVESFHQAWKNFGNYEIKDENLIPNIWLSSRNTKKYIESKCIDYDYDVDRRGIEIDIPDGIIAITPEPEQFGVASFFDNNFNFFFISDRIMVYKIEGVT